MIHIGKEVKLMLKRRKVKIVDFAKEINTNRNNVYNIFERESLDTQLLLRISQVLRFDFFSIYSADLMEQDSNKDADDISIPYENNKTPYQLLKEENEQLKNRLKDKELIIALLQKN